MIKKTAAIVVTYNRKELLLQNIEALLKQTVRNQLEIVIIDNASTDGTFEAIKRYVDKGEIIYINTGSNLGGAGGFQYGIRYAAEHDYEFVWVMDDDCIPRENTLEKFYEADQILKGDYGYLSSKVLWKDGTICSMNRQRKTVVQYNNDFISKYVPIKMASFVSLFIPVRIVKNIPTITTVSTACPEAFFACSFFPAPIDWDMYARNPMLIAEIVLPISQFTVLVAPTAAVALVPRTPTIPVSIYCTAVCISCSSIVGHAREKITGSICRVSLSINLFLLFPVFCRLLSG